MVPTYSKEPRNVTCDDYLFVISDVGHHKEPTTNEFSPEPTNVRGVYHMTGSVIGPRDAEVTLEVTDK